MFCANCGAEINDKAVICVHCGASTLPVAPEKSRKISNAIVLGAVFGCFGVHRFYLGDAKGAWLQLVLGLLTCLLASSIWAIVDIMRLNDGTFTTFDGRKIS